MSSMSKARALNSTLEALHRAAGALPATVAGGTQGRLDAEALIDDGTLDELQQLLERARAQAVELRG